MSSIIGAGFTGLSTALHLREAGIDVAVIEAAEPGWGASGRNNGQVIPTLSRPDPDDIVARHGAAGERFVAMLRDSANALFDLARRYQIQAEQEQTGLDPAGAFARPHQDRRAARAAMVGARCARRVAVARADEGDARLGRLVWRLLEPDAAATSIRWRWRAGWRAPCSIAAAASMRARRRQSFERRGNRWVVKTASGEISGRALVVATNAYTGEFSKSLLPAVAHEVMPVYSWQMATEPLSEAARKTIIPGRQAMSDTHGELYFARYDARNRLVTGGALISAYDGAARLKPVVAARLQRLWPQIGAVKFDYVWNGYVGMTTDFLPRIHRLGPDAYAWTGCNGRAVALSIPLGAELARAVQGCPDSELALPFTAPAPLIAHGLLRRLAPLRLMLFRRADAKEIA